MPDRPGTVPFTVPRVVSVWGHDPVVPFELTKTQSEVMEFALVLGEKKLFEVLAEVEGSCKKWPLCF